MNSRIAVVVALITVLTGALPAQAQQTGTAPAGAKSLAATLDIYVFPTAGQTPEQQSTDEASCYGWAVQNTGSDPFDLQKQDQQSQQQAQQSQQQAQQQQQQIAEAGKGAGVKGAVGGAAVGALVGEIASDDPGEGAAYGAAAGAVLSRHRTRRAQAQASQQVQQQAQQAQQQAQQSQQATAQQMENFKKAFAVCLEGNKYLVRY